MPELAQGTVLAGYRIEGVAGRGGMGVVYRAIQLALERPVALKLIAPQIASDPAFRERFTRESRLAASIDHPNVIPVYEAGEDDGRLFIAMRYVEGRELASLVAEEGPLAPARAVGIVAQVAAALDAAHSRGLVHRDVKPQNILLESAAGSDERSGAGERAYLTDFGLTIDARADRLTRSGQWVGTVDYMAPEQGRGEPVDALADVYALGCVLYTALTGRVPFPREHAAATLVAHFNDPPPTLSGAPSHPPAALGEVVRRALSKDPSERFPSAGDLAATARDALSGRSEPRAEQSVATGLAAPMPPTVLAPVAPVTPASAGAAPTLASRRWRPLVLAGALGLVVGLAVALTVFFALGNDDERGRRGPGAELTVVAIDSTDAGLALGGGVLWVTDPERDVVQRRSPDSGEPLGPPVVTAEGTGEVVAGPDGAWIVNDGATPTLQRLDPESGAITGPNATVELPFAASDVELGPGAVWLISPDGEVARVDAGSGEVSNPVRVTDAFEADLAVGEGAVWVADDIEDVVLRLDPDDGAVVEEVLVPAGVVGLTVGFGTVWVAGNGGLSRIDPGSESAVTLPLDFGGAAPSGGPRVGARHVWVPLDDGTLARVVPETSALAGPPLPIGDWNDIVAGDGFAWVASATHPQLLSVRPAGG